MYPLSRSRSPSSATSRFNHLTSADSSDDLPARERPRTTPRRTPYAPSLAPTPMSSATIAITAHSESCSDRTAPTIRTPRLQLRRVFVESPGMTPTCRTTGVSGLALSGRPTTFSGSVPLESFRGRQLIR